MALQKNTDSAGKIGVLEYLVVFYFFALLIFGRQFTKFNIAGPVYLHDLVLVTLTFLALNNRKKFNIRFRPVFILIFIAFTYLLYSLFQKFNDSQLLILTLRQFNLFLYLLCGLLLFNTLIKNLNDYEKLIGLIKWIGIISVSLQIVFIIYGYLFIPSFSLFAPGEYHYFSPLVVFGIIVYGAYVLASNQNFVLKTFYYVLILTLSTTVGHASAFFALLIIFLTYIFILITPIQRLVALILLILIVVPVLYLPQFSDANASWRILYWKHVLSKLVLEKYMFFGYGFGEPYMTAEYANYINEKIKSPILTDEYGATVRYLSPPHNSFLTMAFHVGLVPMIFLVLPLKGFFRYLFFKRNSGNHNINFLVLSLVGCIIWVSFNVILELPHSATFFWLVYFSVALKVKYTD